MIINTNVVALEGARILGENTTRLSKSLARLSSGSRIVSPDDDAAGLAVSMRLKGQIGRTQAASSNLANAVSFSKTQDGFLQKANQAVSRMSELAILAQDMTKTDTDRGLYDQEFQSLKQYVASLATKDFNGVSLFSSTSREVTTDGEGSTHTLEGIDLQRLFTPITSLGAYSEDFSSDPGWITNDPSHLAQDPATKTFHAWQSNTGTSYAYKPNVWDGKSSFQLDYDVRVNSCAWSAGVTVALFGDNLLAARDKPYLYADLSLVDGGKRVTVQGSNGLTDLASSRQVTWQDNTWYHMNVSYDKDTGAIQLTMTDRSTGQLLDQEGITLNMDTGSSPTSLGVSRLFMEGYSSDAVDYNLDNLSFTSTSGMQTSTDAGSIDTIANAKAALTNVKTALTTLAEYRGTVGSNLSFLGQYQDQCRTLNENLSSANSKIEDADIAEESTEFARANILVQSGTAMLAQANSAPSSVLRLLG